jgi:hypothetical protein
VVVDLAVAELDRLHAWVAGRFRRSEPRARMREYVSGLERKNAIDAPARHRHHDPADALYLSAPAGGGTSSVPSRVRVVNRSSAHPLQVMRGRHGTARLCGRCTAPTGQAPSRRVSVIKEKLR